jgi:hypothetical protein
MRICWTVFIHFPAAARTPSDSPLHKTAACSSGPRGAAGPATAPARVSGMQDAAVRYPTNSKDLVGKGILLMSVNLLCEGEHKERRATMSTKHMYPP